MEILNLKAKKEEMIAKKHKEKLRKKEYDPLDFNFSAQDETYKKLKK